MVRILNIKPSSKAFRQLNREVQSKTKPTTVQIDFRAIYIYCSESWVGEVLDKSRGIGWDLTIVYLFIFS